MTEPATRLNDGQSTVTSEEILTRLKPVMLLIAATLQSAGEHCACGPCRMLQQHAPDLVPLILRMANPEAE